MLKRYLALLAGALVLLIIPVTISSTLRNAAIRGVKPLAEFLTSHNQSLRNTWDNLTNIGTIRDERTKLQQQVVDLQKQVINDETLQRENDDLRKELGVTGTTKDTPKVFARIVVQGDNPLDYTLTIDAGRAQGIQVGQPAVAQGSLIGLVIEVREQTAVVRAITSLQSRVQAWLTSNQEKGFLVGTGNGVELQYISQGLDVPNGTVVETSGLGGTLPQGILIGSVDSLTSAKSEATQTFKVQLPADPLSVQSLFILLTNQP